MDTSKEYIEMCRQAEEIQDIWQDRHEKSLSMVGDYALFPKGKNYLVWFSGDEEGEEYNCYEESDGNPVILTADMSISVDDECLWLPRQDQMQDMVQLPPESAYFLTLRMIKWFQQYGQFDWNGDFPHSFEILWLCFVMYGVYKKRWNGKEWVECASA